MSAEVWAGAAVLLTLCGMSVTGLVWAVRLEGRVNGHDQQIEAHDQQFDDVKDDVKYIRDRIDRALEGRR